MKALIAIFTCHSLDYGNTISVNSRRAIVRETWLKTVKELYPDGSVDVRFFFGAAKSPGRPGSDEVYFNSVPDDYIGAVHKLKAIIRYASKRQYDLLLKVDDDTFLSREMLGHLFNNPKYDYVGHCLPLEADGKTDGYFAAGGAYRLSKRAVSILADAAIPEESGRVIAEDQWVACNLHANGIDAVHDPKYSGYLRGCEELAGRPADAARSEIYRLYWDILDKECSEDVKARRCTALQKKRHMEMMCPCVYFNCNASRMQMLYAVERLSEAEFLSTKPGPDMLRLFTLLTKHDTFAASTPHNCASPIASDRLSHSG